MITIATWETNVPDAETPAERFARTEEQKGGDWQGVNNAPNNLTVQGKLTLDADGRFDRKFNHRGGDLYYDEDGVLHNEDDGRNSREYVDRVTRISAVNDSESRIWTSPESARD